MKKFYKTIIEAKGVYKKKTGHDWEDEYQNVSLITIYHLRHGQNKGKYFVGTFSEWVKLT